MALAQDKTPESDDLPAHVKIGNSVRNLKISMFVLSLICLGMFVGINVLGVNVNSENDKLEHFEEEDIRITEVLDELRQKCKKIENDIMFYLKEIESTPEYKGLSAIMMTEAYTEANNAEITKAIAVTNTTEFAANRKMVQDFKNTLFVTYGSTDYRLFYPKYLAGYHGLGCHTNECDFSGEKYQFKSQNIDGCMVYCEKKRPQGVSGLTFDADKKMCYCSERKPQFFNETGPYLHYRFPRF